MFQVFQHASLLSFPETKSTDSFSGPVPFLFVTATHTPHPREQLERQVKLHSFTQDEALPSWPNSSGTLQLESEMERNPEVPASTREEALFH